MPFLPASRRHIPSRRGDQQVDYSIFYEIYTNAMDYGKMTILKVFLDTLREYPILGIFFIGLLIRKPMKTVIAYIDYFA